MAQIEANVGGLSAQTVFAPVRGGHDRRRQWTLIGVAIVGAVAVTLGVLTYTRMQSVPNAETTGVAVQQAAPEAYAPGGSVYQQQVPAQAAINGIAAEYAPGGSVYEQQVPAATSGESVYAPGGSVYEQQVP